MQKSAGRRPATRWDLLGVAFCLQWLAGCGSLPMLVPDLLLSLENLLILSTALIF